MDIFTLLSNLATILNFFGLVFILAGNFRLFSELNEKLLNSTYVGFSLDRMKRLARKKGLTAAGALLLSLAFGIQGLNLALFSKEWTPLNHYEDPATILAGSIGILLAILAFRLGLSISRRQESLTKYEVAKSRLVKALSQNPVGKVHWSSVVKSAEDLLGIQRRKNEPIREYLRKLAAQLNVKFPSDLYVIEEE